MVSQDNHCGNAKKNKDKGKAVASGASPSTPKRIPAEELAKPGSMCSDFMENFPSSSKAEKLKITAPELCKLKIADGIIPEPLGGAHNDSTWTSQQIKIALMKAMQEFNEMDIDSLLEHRNLKFRQFGGFQEGVTVDAEMKRNMKKKDLPVSEITANLEVELEKLKDALDGKDKSPRPLPSDEVMQKLKQEVDKETTSAFISMGLQEKLESLKMDLSKLPSDQTPTPALQERVDMLVQEFKNNLSIPGSFDGLKKNLKMLLDIRTQHESKIRGERFKKEINEKLQDQAKEKTELLRRAREMAAKGELDNETLEKAEKAKEDLIEMLNSANLEVLGVSRKLARSAPPVLVDTVVKANETIFEEIDKIVDETGLRGKLAELRSEIDKGPGKDQEKVVSLIKEIKEGILTSLDADDLENKVKSIVGLPAVPKAVSAVFH